MPSIRCPVVGCSYVTEDVEPAIVAALLAIHGPTHASPPSVAGKPDRVKRPEISSSGTTAQWLYFLTRWGDYKHSTRMTDRDTAMQLMECCSDQLRMDLTRIAGGSMINSTEDEVLTAIKALAVRKENKMVAIDALQRMTQDRDEPIRAFGARVRGQASVCKFHKTCACGRVVNYSEETQAYIVTKGLTDKTIRRDLMSQPNQDMTLDEILDFVESKESGKRSDLNLDSPESLEAMSSSYRRQSKQTPTPAPETPPTRDNTPRERPRGPQGSTCSHCGGSHGRNRQTSCPAFGSTCNHCSRLHHFAKVCRSKRQGKPPQKPEQEGAISHTICSLPSATSSTSSTLDHHVHIKRTRNWSKQQSKPQPHLTLTAETTQADFNALGITLRSERQITVSAMADTGCQSCLASLSIAKRLGFNKSTLIPVDLKMNAATGTKIPILGAIVLKLTSHNKGHTPTTTRQMVYISEHADKLFISREACADLGLISPDFPRRVNNTSTTASTTSTEEPTQPAAQSCTCPRRTAPPPRPTTLPFAPTTENRAKLEQYLLDTYASSTFNICEHQTLPMMTGPPMRLLIDPNATPKVHHTPIPVPMHWQSGVKDGLDRDVRLGVIEQVPIGDPVTWCHRMVICPKKDGTPRRTIDFQPLNAHATRDTHHTMSPFHQARSVPHHVKKTVFDAWNGYHSVPLHPDDRHYTTFITPWGRYRYLTAPQGYIASGDGYTRRYDEIVADIHDKTKCIDDALIWADTIEASFHRATEWLDLCGKKGITLTPKKFRFAEDSVEFAGFEITPTSVRPCAKFHKAISEFPTPTNLTDIRSWFGLVNQVSYSFSMTAAMLPFRTLLKPGNKFSWTEDLQTALVESKEYIVGEIKHGVSIYDKTRPTCLATDWSKDGIGFWLFQKHCACPSRDLFCCREGWRVTLVGSRFTHPAESKYSAVEGEALAVADALEKSRHFVLGCHDLTIAVDHKPLLKIFGDRALDLITNSRLRNLKEKTLKYRFSMIHIPGVRNRAPDALSRNPSGSQSPQMMPLEDELSSSGSPAYPRVRIPIQLMSGITISDTVDTADCQTTESICGALLATKITSWHAVQQAMQHDHDLLMLIDKIQSGFPTLQETPAGIRSYHALQEHLMVCDGVATYKGRTIIPNTLRTACLSALHAAHQGTAAMIARADISIYWPGITRDIADKRASCQQCHAMAPSQASLPPITPQQAAYPFQLLCADYFTYKGFNYLVIVDRYSNWPILERARDGANGLVDLLRKTFSTFGIPDELSSDGGPEFTSHTTQRFLADWGVHHRLSSVANPHSNCRAEVGVKSMKRLVTGNTRGDGSLDINNFQQAMLTLRNSPDPTTKLSPAIVIFGRPTKDAIPIYPGKYRPHKTWLENSSGRETTMRQRLSRGTEKWSQHTRPLKPLTIGTAVMIQNQTGNHPTKWDTTGRVIEVKPYHQYLIRVDGSGRATLRNRKFLRAFIPLHETILPNYLPPQGTLLARPILPQGTLPARPPQGYSPSPQLADIPPTTPMATSDPRAPTLATSVPPQESPSRNHVPPSSPLPSEPPQADRRASSRLTSKPAWHEAYLF